MTDAGNNAGPDAVADTDPQGASGPAALVAGERVGRYVVERPIGAGGMGVVSLARDPELRRQVVIKLVHPNMGFGEGGDELEARLRREAQAMAQVSHTNVVQIFDIGRRGDRVFLAMEFVAGQTLGAWLRERRRTTEEILAVIGQAGAGLAAAHRVGLVHRDFKPSNVLVGNDGVVKVTDFGLARAIAPGDGAALTRQLRAADAGVTRPLRAGGVARGEPPRASGVHAVLTQAHDVVGTPGYMAPEQAAGERIDARTDQYAFAATLLDALLGQPVTRRLISPEDPPAVIGSALAQAGVAPPVRAAILRALSEAPAARFPAIDDLLRALATPAPRRSRRWLLLLGVALCGAGVAVWLVSRQVAPGCAPEAPRQWTAARGGVVAALSATRRPFASWDAARVATAIDGAVDQIAGMERARCDGAPVAAPDPACLDRRRAALTAAIDACSASPPPPDPWALVAAVQACDGTARYQRLTELAGRLHGASDATARDLITQARALGDERLVADAQDVIAQAALAAGDLAAAEQTLLAMSETGERAGLDEVRGRARLRLIELARWRGTYAAAKRELDELHAIVARHGDGARDVLTVALVEGDALTELGDAAGAFAAWDRAQRAAATLGDPDAVLTAAIGQAWSTYALRRDVAGARAAAATAIHAAGEAASATARGAALATSADLALAAGDGAAAVALIADAQRIDPARLAPATAPARDPMRGIVTGAPALDPLRALRGRALTGDVDDALAALPAPDDALDHARAEVTRGQILLAAGRAAEATAVLDRVRLDVQGYGKRGARAPMASAERLELELTACEAQLAADGRCKSRYQIERLLEGLHPDAPIRARFAIDRGAPRPTPETPTHDPWGPQP